MRDRLWYAGPLIVIGIAALAAVLAVAASGSPTASDARTKTLSLAVAGTDADYTDPALSYSGLGLADRVCDLLEAGQLLRCPRLRAVT